MGNRSDTFKLKKICRFFLLIAFLIFAGIGVYKLILGSQTEAIRNFIIAGVIFVINFVMTRFM